MKFFAVVSAFLIIFCSGIALAERLAVAVPVANIRSGPGTSHDILWNAEKYYPIFVFEKSGPWYHFRDFEGDEGWIHKSLVQKIASIITIKPKCNIRSGPGSRYKIRFSVEDGIPFRVLGRKGNWIHIEHADGDKGWIYKTLTW
jgi:SH3-like domain-containing protein